MAGGGVDKIVTGDGYFFALRDVFQSLLEKFKVQALLAFRVNALCFAVVAVGQEIIQFNRCDMLSGLFKCFLQAFDDFSFSSSGWTCNREQNGMSL